MRSHSPGEPVIELGAGEGAIGELGTDSRCARDGEGGTVAAVKRARGGDANAMAAEG
jgi:hypothetical protein